MAFGGPSFSREAASYELSRLRFSSLQPSSEGKLALRRILAASPPGTHEFLLCVERGQKLGLDKQGKHSSGGAGAASRILGPSFSVESELQRFSPLGLALIPHLPSSSRAAPPPTPNSRTSYPSPTFGDFPPLGLYSLVPTPARSTRQSLSLLGREEAGSWEAASLLSSHVPTCPGAPLFSSSSPSPTTHPYPNEPAPCVPPSSVSVCSPHIPTHPFFDLQLNWLNAHILPSPSPPALRTLCLPAARRLGNSVFEDTVDIPSRYCAPGAKHRRKCAQQPSRALLQLRTS